MKPDELHLCTIGHSNRSLEEFADLLEQHSIGMLADIRRFPASRKFPHFNREYLSESLRESGVDYEWLQGLGGRRNASNQTSANNEAWQNKSFRNYADYMQTEEFRSAFQNLVRLAKTCRTVIMCSESVFWRCHRRLVSDYFTASGGHVEHIFSDGRTQPHELTDTAIVQSDNPVTITYPGDPTLLE